MVIGFKVSVDYFGGGVGYSACSCSNCAWPDLGEAAPAEAGANTSLSSPKDIKA
ncbi:MAG: hypothetical protein U0T74_11885 [Chitinophagales bacterium]